MSGCVLLILEFGSGFYLDFFGCDNICLNVVMFGFGEEEVEE